MGKISMELPSDRITNLKLNLMTVQTKIESLEYEIRLLNYQKACFEHYLNQETKEKEKSENEQN